MKWIICLFALRMCWAFVHPIKVHGHYFVDTVTEEPFYVKGVDYQPGGSSAVSLSNDPLSDPKTCARDVILFQELGINTIRIYSINPDLNHDVCMSLLATAGIYLVLDVNSPLPGQHLNRYEPWTTYTTDYLEHVFKVVEQFSYYNNTLGFFAGNEIINDNSSATHSPTYVKAVIRDIKRYIEKNSPRVIPVGYSAADDLRYRMPLADYLACVQDSSLDAVDFYGVNSYQWCGEQTFYTSGYNLLVADYSHYPRPVFFSEYGCNEVSPRLFEEVRSLYSTDMADTFAGGLVYEFTQEPNNYGLVEIMENGDVNLLEDFIQLKTQFDILTLDYQYTTSSTLEHTDEILAKSRTFNYSLPECEANYENLDTSKPLPSTAANLLINLGVKVERGKFVNLDPDQLTSSYKVSRSGGPDYPLPRKVNELINIMSGSEIKKPSRISNHANGT
ncbi:glycoside hydrolase family 72 protein [Suhomyces tanzawaensis NRRL Y-17324]|uniref:1,3-beta-glucanosyltransferase n=1 Tax=Suhomyces tanzawaensis NRRL Y-17324 TaxID=984487 RepID=A0A1E4SDX6_9ASCO|nr:glycoside hydrolase family 72 protein [Suhomyces tanzawaensis NRRL Y-17324]ODV77719.1 glycoside hydrolase family 72 protein [Suhomyces tanzawaensis NRRL Y-17324]